MLELNYRLTIYRFRGYASPFLSRDEGIAILSETTASRLPSSRGWAEFVIYCNMYPDLSDSMSQIYELNWKASDIYLARVRAGSSAPGFVDLVEDFKNTMESFPVGFPGEHTLVWSCFLVALESSTPDHRHFFAETLLRYQKKQGFANLSKAIEHLATIWATVNDYDWVSLLTRLDVFVV